MRELSRVREPRGGGPRGAGSRRRRPRAGIRSSARRPRLRASARADCRPPRSRRRGSSGRSRRPRRRASSGSPRRTASSRARARARSSARRCPSRPPATRISARGFTSRISASARRPRSGVSEPSDCTGLPSIGIRKFTGIEGTSSSRSLKATSTTSGAALAHAEDHARCTARCRTSWPRAACARGPRRCASSRSPGSATRWCSGCGSGGRGPRRRGSARAPPRAGRPRGTPRSG